MLNSPSPSDPDTIRKAKRFSQRILGGFLICTSLLTAIAYFAFEGIRDLVRQNESVIHTYQVLGVLDDTQLQVHELQSSQRSYLLTDQDAYLTQYHAARYQIPRNCERLRLLVTDNPDQMKRLTLLEQYLHARLEAAAEAVTTFHRQGLPEAQNEVRAGKGERTMTEVRDAIHAMETAEQALLDERQQASQAAAYALLRGCGAGVLVIFAISAGLFALVRRESNRRAATEVSLKQTNEKMEQSLADTRRLTHETAAVAAMGDYLQTCRTPKEAYAVLTRIVPQLLPNVAGAVSIISNSRNLVETVFTWGGDFTHEFTPEECWGLRRGRTHYVPKSNGCDPTCTHVGPAPDGYLCMPMVIQGETLGVLSLRAQGGHPIGDVERRAARAVAEQISLALANLRLQEALRVQSIRDPLTGLYNRRYLEESLDREIARARREDKPVAVVMIDVDHFKRFNDSHGHEGGDALLSEFGKLLARHVRSEDIPCRFGGEEFCLVLPGADIEIARSRAEDIRDAVKRLSVTCRRQPLGPVTLSGGVAVVPTHGGTGDMVIAAADAALYRAKRAGRDRVEAAADPESLVVV